MSHNNNHGCNKERFNSRTDTTESIQLSDSLPSQFVPEDVINEILLRVPLKTLIFDPQFVKGNLNRDHQLLPSSPIVGNRRSCSVKSLFDNPTNPVFDSGLMLEPIREFEIVGSCNGFLCCLAVVVKRKSLKRKGFKLKSFSFNLYNPVTGWKSRIPYHFYKKVSTVFGFGYDDSTDQYKVVSLFLDPFHDLYGIEVKVCTFGDHHSLRRYRSFSAPTFRHWSEGTTGKAIGTFLKDTLNWLVEDLVSEFILSFHLGKETFGKVLLPVDEDFCHSYSSCIGVLKDCLYFSADNVAKTKFIVWLMKDYGVEDSWTKLYTISYLDSDLDSDLGKRLYYQGGIKVISMSEDGKVLLHIRDHQFALHNSKDNTFKYFEIEGFQGLVISHVESLA